LSSKNGILLCGPPGNGKTRLARCTASYISRLLPGRRCRFMSVSGSQDYGMWFGQSEARLRARFAAVRKAALDGPVLLFFDEIDAIGRRRGSDHGSGAPDRILSTLLAELDGIHRLDGVTILAATNRADTLDDGLVRAGRLTVKIAVPAPNRQTAQAVLRQYLDNGRPLSTPAAEPLIAPLLSAIFSPRGQYARVAEVKLNDGRVISVAGKSLLNGAMLEAAAGEAAKSAARRESRGGEGGITTDDLAVAFEAQLASVVALLTAANVKSYVTTLPRDSHPVDIVTQLGFSTTR
jgi:SpoVK/Ycf46/Vps4 family AAA+-type ATPase